VIAQTRAEVLKIRSTRTTLGLLLGMVGLVLLIVVLTTLLDDVFSLQEKENQRDLFGIAYVPALFAAIAGVLVVASEYRFGTIRPTFVFTPHRSRVIASKLVAGLLAGLAFGVVSDTISFGLGVPILDSRGVDIALDSHDIWLILIAGTVGTALFAGIGVGLASVVHNQVASVIGLLAWIFVVDNLLFGLAPHVGRYMPSLALNALIGNTGDDLLSPAGGAVMLAVWAAGLTVAGVALTARRDVG
jgi:ABC-2 type transport system permease protein